MPFSGRPGRIDACSPFRKRLEGGRYGNMKKLLLTAACAFALTLPAHAQTEAPEEPAGAPSPNEIVSSATPEEWIAIQAEDLLVMTLAPDRDGKARTVILQLMPAPFSQGWVENIRTLARAEWYDGISVNRVQDNYVVQWGDPGHDNPESGEVETKPLPEGLRVMEEADYEVRELNESLRHQLTALFDWIENREPGESNRLSFFEPGNVRAVDSNYGFIGVFERGFPISLQLHQHFASSASSVHCYGMVGVGRSYSPDTGSGAELYTVIGHAPRHLDRNIALVGRIISGMEHLSSLPRGSGALGFYTEEEADQRTPIQSIRVASDLPETARPQFEYLSTEGATFARYAEARANRRDPFFIVPAGGADICNIPVPVRAIEQTGDE